MWVEYVVILAAVIIIALIAAYLAGGFPSTSKQISQSDSAAYWLSTDIAIVSYSMNSTMAQLVIRNNRNFRINVTAITSQGSGTIIAKNGASSIILEPSQSAQVNVSGLACFAAIYSLPLVINYTDVQYKTAYSFYGDEPLIGTCMGSSALCSSSSQCGTTPCPSEYCTGSGPYFLWTYPSTCSNTCSGGNCQSCSCTASSTNCGNNTTTSCPSNYCAGNPQYLYSYTSPSPNYCYISCSGSGCAGSCTAPSCTVSSRECMSGCTAPSTCYTCGNNGQTGTCPATGTPVCCNCNTYCPGNGYVCVPAGQCKKNFCGC